MIRIPQVRVVDEEGAQLGVMPTAQALAMAQERGYDLVEVAPMASPPVVKFLDFGQYKYELTKRDKEAKRRQRSVTFKEVRLTPKIGSGDFDTKVHRAIEFLEDGDRIKVTVRFRGRELTHPELGRNMLARFTDRIKEHGVPERAPLLEGKSMHLTVASVHKPKEHDVAARPPRPGEAAALTNGTARDATPAPAERETEPAVASAAPTTEAKPAAAAVTPTEAKPAAAAVTPTEAKPAAAAAKPAAATAKQTEPKPSAATSVATAEPPPTPVAAAAPAAAAKPAKSASAKKSSDTPAASPPAATGK
jgi:translation initiation factor IF-3